MKKISILFIMLMTAFSSSLVKAGSYKSLKFTSNSGETFTVLTNNLEILVNGENLSFNNTDLTIPLSSLVSMEFTEYDESQAAVDCVVFDSKGIVTVYDIKGSSIGTFDSYTEALALLNQGVYVIIDINGNSLKICVGK